MMVNLSQNWCDEVIFISFFLYYLGVYLSGDILTYSIVWDGGVVILFGNGDLQRWETLALVGHLIVCNCQIHSYQIKLINSYIDSKNNNDIEHYITDILDHKKERIELSKALRYFSEESDEQKDEVYVLLRGIASIDGLIDEEERNFFIELNKRAGYSEEKLAELEKISFEIARRVIEIPEPSGESNPDENAEVNWFLSVVNKFIKWIKSFFSKEEVEKQESMINEILYNEVIDECAVVAKEDFEVIKPVYEKILNNSSEVCKQLEKYKKNIKLSASEEEEINKVLDSFSDVINNEIHNQIGNYKKELYRKEHALSDFTVSLVGRTKAGKTTLHSILTGEGKKNIGIGMQRTTRYNRVYQWQRLRLIDTPGIGSAEAEGRTDDEIAESVISESDVVCFLVVDDSIQKDVLDFIEKILKRNKPIILLINHKENIRTEARYKRYMENPNKWIEKDGEDSINGHIRRIERYVDSIECSHLLKIYPVFLLGALMADEDEHKTNRSVLRQSSGIDEFLDGLRTTIILNGSINRTQTIIDDTVGLCINWKDKVKNAINPITKLSETLKQKIDKANKVLTKAEEVFEKECREYLNYKFEDLANVQALTFAEQYYKDKDNIKENWTRFLKDIDFEGDISREVGKYQKKYNEKVESVLREILEDLEITFKSINLNTDGMGFVSDFSFKAIINIFGSLLSIAGVAAGFLVSGPAGWVLGIAGLVLNLGSFLFKSKKKKRQEAINKVYDQLREKILENKDENIDTFVNEISGNCESTLSKVNHTLTELIVGFDKLEKITSSFGESFDNEIDMLNKVYAWRIINYLIKRKLPLSMDMVDEDIEAVYRNYGEEMEIVTRIEDVTVNEGINAVIKDKIEITFMEDVKHG